MKAYILAAVLLVLVCTTGCLTDEDRTIHTLQSAGYTNIHTTGWDFGCGEGDMFHTGFAARNPQGATVSGVVCCGVLKGCTIRF